MEIHSVKFLCGTHTISVEASSCHYIGVGWLDILDSKSVPVQTSDFHSGCIPGVWYKPNSVKFGVKLEERDIFVPMTAVTQITYNP